MANYEKQNRCVKCKKLFYAEHKQELCDSCKQKSVKKFKLRVVADANDADYVESTQPVDQETIDFWRKLAKKIKEFKPYEIKEKGYRNISHRHNWPDGEMCREDLGEKHYTKLYGISEEEDEMYVYDYVPNGQYGIHTIESIEIFPNVESEILL